MEKDLKEAVKVLMFCAANDRVGADGVRFSKTTEMWSEKVSSAWTTAFKYVNGKDPKFEDYRLAGMSPVEK